MAGIFECPKYYTVAQLRVAEKNFKINRLSYLKLFSPGAQEYYMSMSHVRWAFSPKLFSFL